MHVNLFLYLRWNTREFISKSLYWQRRLQLCMSQTSSQRQDTTGWEDLEGKNKPPHDSDVISILLITLSFQKREEYVDKIRNHHERLCYNKGPHFHFFTSKPAQCHAYAIGCNYSCMCLSAIHILMLIFPLLLLLDWAIRILGIEPFQYSFSNTLKVTVHGIQFNPNLINFNSSL